MTDIARVHGRQSTDEDSSRIPVMAFLAEFSFAFTTTTQSAEITHVDIKDSTPFVVLRLCTTADCWLAFGANPTAVVGDGVFLPAGVIEFWRVPVGFKVAAVQATAGGSLSVVIME